MAENFQVVIEINAGSRTKYEVNKKGELVVDRFLRAPFVYPFDYGFIEGTHARDGDPLDVMVISSGKLVPGSTITCHAIGMLEMQDQAGDDPKIIAVPEPQLDPVYGKYKAIKQVAPEMLAAIKYFFQNYKTGQPGKWSRVTGFKGERTAKRLIQKSLEL